MLALTLLILALECAFYANTQAVILMREWVAVPILQQIFQLYAWVILMFVTVAGFEWLYPPKGKRRRYQLTGLAYWAHYLMFSLTAIQVANQLKSSLGIVSLIDLSAHPSLKLVYLFVFDGFYCAFHRLQHAVPLLWKFHAVHHSIESLSATHSYQHISEDFLRIPLVTIPTALIVEAPPGHLLFFTAFTLAWATFIHMRSSINFGIAGRILADNRYHWIHHSTHPEHHNRNFAAFFPVWDVLFKTVHWPRKGEELPPVGLSHRQEPQSIMAYLRADLEEK